MVLSYPIRLCCLNIYMIDKKYRGKKIGRQLLETLEKESKCTCSIAYFEKGLSEYYSNQGYMIGDTLVGLKDLSSNDKPN